MTCFIDPACPGSTTRASFFYYPLRPLNALKGLGGWEGLVIVLSYLKSQLVPYRREDTFEEWVTNRFEKRLFQTFFKTYTEKVWGIPCSELKAEWAAQRIKDLSLRTALLNMLLKSRGTIRTLIEEFDYPRYGPGMMWNAVKSEIERRAGTVRLEAEVVRINRTGCHIDSITVLHHGREETIKGTNFISSMPVTEFVRRLEPAAVAVLDAAARLRYRDFLTVICIVGKPELYPDNWIYVHDPEVQVGRIQNFKNWSPDMVPDSAKTSLGLEYFCTEGDPVWMMPDEGLIQLTARELERIGLCRAADVEDGCVVRVPRAYAVYGSDYCDALAVVREFIDSLENFRTIGRNGLHRYNNQDHAMMTGILAVRSMVLGELHGLWNVNTDHEYHEEIQVAARRPRGEVEAVVQEELTRVFLRIDRVALGLATGVLSGVGLFVATLALTLTEGPVIGPTLELLGQYFPGYSVTALGSVVGLFYASIGGFVAGWLFATLRNAIMFISLVAIYRSMQLRRILDYWEMRSGSMAHLNNGDADIVLTRLARFNATVQGLVSGILLGGVIFLATNWLVLKGGEAVGPHLALLDQFFVGYQVTFVGSMIGFGYGLAAGFIAGYLVATLYNWFGVRRDSNRAKVRSPRA
jgi:protoporphyrinogen oxidase